MIVVGVATLHPVKHKRALRAADTAALLGAQLDNSSDSSDQASPWAQCIQTLGYGLQTCSIKRLS